MQNLHLKQPNRPPAPSSLLHPLYQSLQNQKKVDMVLDGVEDLRMKYVPLIYQAKLVRWRVVLTGGGGW
jgi:hypothetical protein